MEIETPEGQEISSFFVDKSLVVAAAQPVRGREVPGWIRVDTGRGTDEMNVVLPVEQAAHGWMISVPSHRIG